MLQNFPLFLLSFHFVYMYTRNLLLSLYKTSCTMYNIFQSNKISCASEPTWEQKYTLVTFFVWLLNTRWFLTYHGILYFKQCLPLFRYFYVYVYSRFLYIIWLERINEEYESFSSNQLNHVLAIELNFCCHLLVLQERTSYSFVFRDHRSISNRIPKMMINTFFFKEH